MASLVKTDDSLATGRHRVSSLHIKRQLQFSKLGVVCRMGMCGALSLRSLPSAQNLAQEAGGLNLPHSAVGHGVSKGRANQLITVLSAWNRDAYT